MIIDPSELTETLLQEHPVWEFVDNPVTWDEQTLLRLVEPNDDLDELGLLLIRADFWTPEKRHFFRLYHQ